MSQFESPRTSSDTIDWSTLNGALLIVEVIEVTDEIQTVHGPSDAVRANISVVEGNRAGAEYNDALVFPRMLKSQLRGKVGKKVLGRLSQGTASAGKNPPWLLDEANDSDNKKATEFLARQTTGQLSGPDVI